MSKTKEFRVFVNQGRIEGASHHPNYMGSHQPSLDDIRIVKSTLPTFIEKIRCAVPFSEIVIDMAISTEGNSHRVWLVDLNSYDRSTNPGLFDWDSKDFDISLRWMEGDDIRREPIFS